MSMSEEFAMWLAFSHSDVYIKYFAEFKEYKKTLDKLK